MILSLSDNIFDYEWRDAMINVVVFFMENNQLREKKLIYLNSDLRIDAWQ